MEEMEEQRPTPKVTDTEATRQKLQKWFASQMPEAREVAISEMKIPEGTGMSCVTLIFDLNWKEHDVLHTKPCVGRLQPDMNNKTIFPEYDLGLQYRVMEALADTPIKVPPLFGLEQDDAVLGVQFYIMERIPGRVISDMPPYHMGGWMHDECTPEQRTRLWWKGLEAMGEVHLVDWKTPAFDFQVKAEKGATPLAQQLQYWQHYLNWGFEGREHPLCQQALDWLHANQPGDEPVALCWGDSRLSNLIFSPTLDDVTAVIDWENAALGNPTQDLAWWIVLDRCFSEGLGVPRLDGLPGTSETITAWENQTGFKADHYHYYEVFAGLRFALIIGRIMIINDTEEMVVDNFVTGLLAKMLE
jgi:aminoglycoside phosphotransferase (APT) family kinase protein